MFHLKQFYEIKIHESENLDTFQTFRQIKNPLPFPSSLPTPLPLIFLAKHLYLHRSVHSKSKGLSNKKIDELKKKKGILYTVSMNGESSKHLLH